MERLRILALRDEAALGRSWRRRYRVARRYADRYGLNSLDFEVLLVRVDIIPPSLAIARLPRRVDGARPGLHRKAMLCSGSVPMRHTGEGSFRKIVPRVKIQGAGFRSSDRRRESLRAQPE